VVLFGNGAIAKLAYHELLQNSGYEVAAFTVDRDYCLADRLLGLPVVPFDQVASSYPPAEYRMLISIGYVKMNKLKAARYQEAKQMGYQLISHISPRAVTWPGLEFGDNCFIGPNSVVYPSARIGNNVFIGACCVIPHDSVIHDHCFLSDGVVLSGSVTVEPFCFLGTGSTIRNKVKIARECVIGAGAVILADTAEKGVYMGKPAEQLPIASDKLPLS
jgi:sugar O-acyltransferase (sialic acid O-acetyltransferase NeuD family)